MSVDLYQLAGSILVGDRAQAVTLTQQAIAEGLDAQVIIADGLIAGMAEVGVKFKANEFYVPDVLIAARAMNECLVILKPFFSETTIQPLGTVVIGTVKGDIHEVGKNLVAMMLRGNGFEVIDLGVDAAASMLVEAAQAHRAQVVALSTLLTTTMPRMKEVVEAFAAAGLRERVKILVGGAPVTQEFANQIAADGYAPDAAGAVEVTKALLQSLSQISQ
jgi:5-methyltetrahydrofolate--homocysteine methyltransferase